MLGSVVTLEEKKYIARKYIEELQNAKNISIIDELLTADCIIRIGSRIVDKEKYKNIVRSNYKSFPDNHVEIINQIAEDDTVVTQWKSSFTHTQRIMDMEPTFEEVVIAGTSIHKIIGSMIVEIWIYWDRQEMLDHLGVKPGRLQNIV